MEYALGAVAGLIFGGLIGQLKNLFIWKKYPRESASSGAEANTVGGLYARAGISYFVNILTLAAAFFSSQCSTVPRAGLSGRHGNCPDRYEQGAGSQLQTL